jgi:hypothetical protein
MPVRSGKRRINTLRHPVADRRRQRGHRRARDLPAPGRDAISRQRRSCGPACHARPTRRVPRTPGSVGVADPQRTLKWPAGNVGAGRLRLRVDPSNAAPKIADSRCLRRLSVVRRRSVQQSTAREPVPLLRCCRRPMAGDEVVHSRGKRHTNFANTPEDHPDDRISAVVVGSVETAADNTEERSAFKEAERSRTAGVRNQTARSRADRGDRRCLLSNSPASATDR